MQFTEPIVAGVTAGRVCAIAIPSALQAVRIATSLTCIIQQAGNASQIGDLNLKFKYDIKENEVNQSPLELYLNGQRISNEPVQLLNSLLQNQEIVKIQRCAMSLWKHFPSGVVSFFSMLFLNQCARHEYLIIYTKDYAVSAEVSRSKDCQVCQYLNQQLGPNFQEKECQCKKKSSKKQYCFQIMIWDAKSEKDKKRIYEQYNKREFSRVLKCFSIEQNNIAQNFSFSKLLCLWRIMWNIYQAQSGDGNLKTFYRLLYRNCKTLARTSFYFLEKDLKEEKVFESMFGLYCDKPGYLFDPIQSGILCAVENGIQLIRSSYKNAKIELENLIKLLRQSKI